MKKMLAPIAFGLLLSANATASDYTLSFDRLSACGTACSDWSKISQTYGDVAGVVDVNYIDVLHPYIDALHPGDSPRWWSTNYNNLVGVVFANGGDGKGESHGRIEIKAANGKAVTLDGMDFGAYSYTTRNTSIRVTAIGGGASLFAYDGAVGAGTSHTTFAPKVTSKNGLWIDWYDSAYNVGIDNVAFSLAAPVPEPEGYAMFLAGLGLIGGIASRRRRRG